MIDEFLPPVNIRFACERFNLAGGCARSVRAWGVLTLHGIELTLPTLHDYELDESARNYGPYACYSHYLYLRRGFTSWLNRRRLKIALQFARPWFGGRAMDFGCGDGILLPTLSRQFRQVTGIDYEPKQLDLARTLARNLRLDNVRLACNRDAPLPQLADGPYDVIFALETLEHVGTPGNMYPSKLVVVRELVSLLASGGALVTEVPIMVGPRFMLKYISQAVLRRYHEKLSFAELLRSAVLSDTDALEERWAGGHIGFNHKKLRNLIVGEFNIIRELTHGDRVFWVVTPG